MNSVCNFSRSITVGGCVADSGPPVPATVPDPQPSSLVISDYDPTQIVVGVCPAAGSLFSGTLPYMSNPNNTTQLFCPQTTNICTDPVLVNGAGLVVKTTFNASSNWQLKFSCFAGGANIWTGQKLVGTDPLGTYMRVSGSSPTPPCLHIIQQNVSWTPMVWVPNIFQPNGSCTAVGNANTFSCSAQTNDGASKFGMITGTMNYTGPVIGCRIRMTVITPDNGTPAFSQFVIHCNGIRVVEQPVVGLSAAGVTDHYFAIFNPASPGNNMVNMPVEVKCTAQTNIPGNNPSFSGQLF